MSEVWQNQRLLLMHLDTAINLRESSFEIDIVTVQSDEMKVSQSVVPGKSSQFLFFPFKECAKCINQATEELTIFADPFFKFKDEREEFHHKYFSFSSSYSEDVNQSILVQRKIMN